MNLYLSPPCNSKDKTEFNGAMEIYETTRNQGFFLISKFEKQIQLERTDRFFLNLMNEMLSLKRK